MHSVKLFFAYKQSMRLHTFTFSVCQNKNLNQAALLKHIKGTYCQNREKYINLIMVLHLYYRYIIFILKAILENKKTNKIVNIVKLIFLLN